MLMLCFPSIALQFNTSLFHLARFLIFISSNLSSLYMFVFGVRLSNLTVCVYRQCVCICVFVCARMLMRMRLYPLHQDSRPGNGRHIGLDYPRILVFYHGLQQK